MNVAGAIMLAVSAITAKEVRASPTPLKNYRPAFESIVLGKPLVSQDQELVATVKGIMEKLDTHSSEKGVGEKIKTIQVDFATRIDNNIIRMGLENLDFLVTTVPKEYLPRLLEICHREMLVNPDRADAIPRILGNICSITGTTKLSDESIRRVMRAGFAKSTSLCPKEVSVVIKTEFDSGRLDHIEGVAEARATQEQTAMSIAVNTMNGVGNGYGDIKTQEVQMATNNRIYTMDLIDANGVVQQSYTPSIQRDNYEVCALGDPRAGINSYPSSVFQVDKLVQRKPKQAKRVDTRTDNLLLLKQISTNQESPAKTHQRLDEPQAAKEENIKETQGRDTKQQKNNEITSGETKKREGPLEPTLNAKTNKKEELQENESEDRKSGKNKKKKNGNIDKNSRLGSAKPKMLQRKKLHEPKNKKSRSSKLEKARTDNNVKTKGKEKKKRELAKEKAETANKRKVKSELIRKRREGKEKEEITKPKEKNKDTKNLRRELHSKRKKRGKAGITAIENKKKQTRQRSTEPKNARVIVRKVSKPSKVISCDKIKKRTRRERQKQRTAKKGILRILLMPLKKRKRTMNIQSRTGLGEGSVIKKAA